MMKSRSTIAVVFACLFFSAPSAFCAEDAPKQQPSSFAELFNPAAIHEQMRTTIVAAIDTYLEYLSKPETAAKLASFQRSYYDALIEKGFTEDQAFQLVRDFGNPLRGSSMKGN